MEFLCVVCIFNCFGSGDLKDMWVDDKKICMGVIYGKV